jgi:drug/metabolite transporter (DMT)-like permease
LQLAAGCMFLVAASWIGRTPSIRWSQQLRRPAGLGVLNPGLAYAPSWIGLTSISASTSVLLWVTEPVLIGLLAILLLRERLSAPLAAAMVLAVAGALALVYRPDAPFRSRICNGGRCRGHQRISSPGASRTCLPRMSSAGSASIRPLSLSLISDVLLRDLATSLLLMCRPVLTDSSPARSTTRCGPRDTSSTRVRN